MFPLIAIEGIDGVGKTTIAQAITRKLGGHFTPTPVSPLSIIRRGIEALGHTETRFLYYLTGVVALVPRLDELLASGPVICDRYIYSTVAYHRALGSGTAQLPLDTWPVRVPDLAIQLTATDEVRRARLHSRSGNSSFDARLERDVDLLQRVTTEFSKLGLPVLDTTALTIEETVSAVNRMIESRRKEPC